MVNFFVSPATKIVEAGDSLRLNPYKADFFSSSRYDVSLKGIEQWVTNLLPSRQFGYLVLTTSRGIMDHEEARKKKIGGKVMGFFY